MSSFTNFGVIGTVDATTQAFVTSSINQATRNKITQSNTAQIGAIPQYITTSGDTVQATPYTLPSTVGVNGQTLVVSGGNLVYGAGGGGGPVSSIASGDASSSITCNNGATIQSQGEWSFSNAKLTNVGSVSSVDTTLGMQCGQSFLQLANIADGSIPEKTSYFSAGNGTTNAGFVATIDSALIVRDGGGGTVVRVTIDGETKLFNAQGIECVRVYQYGTQIHGEGQPAASGLKCNINLDGDIFFNREDPVFGLAGIFLCQGSNTRIWSPSNKYEVDIDESHIKLKRNLVDRVVADENTTSILSRTNVTSISVNDLYVKMQFSTADRLIIDSNDITFRDANSNDRIIVDTTTGFTSLRSPNGLADRIDIDPLGAYISVGGQPVFYANPTNTDTRIWSPDGTKVISVENAGGVRIDNSYYLPATDGTNGQVLSTNGAGQTSWQTPLPLNAFNQTLNTTDNVTFNSLSINTAYSLPSTTGTTGQVLTYSSGTAQWQTPQILGFYSQTAPTSVVNTTAQTTIIGPGVGSLTVPPNYFTAGMGFTYRTGGLFGALNNATIRFRLINSGTLFDSGLLQFSPSVALGRPWNIDVTFIYVGLNVMITNFNFQYNNGSDARGFTAQNTNNTFNPAISNTLDVTVQWGAASNSNSIGTNYGVLTKIY